MPMRRFSTGTRSTPSPPMPMRPESGKSKPAIMRSSVVLPLPGRPEQRIEAAVGEIDRHLVERLVRAESARDVFDLDIGHYFSPPNLKKRAVTSIRPIETAMMMVDTALISGVKPLRIAA